MNTLGSQSKVKVTKEESYCIAHSFDGTDGIKLGAVVKLNADGTVAPVAAVTDFPLGMVTRGNNQNSVNSKVTVLTPFVAIATGVSSGATTTAQELAAEAVDAEGNQKWKTAAAGNYVSAIALSDGTDGGEVTVGVLRVPYKKA